LTQRGTGEMRPEIQLRALRPPLRAVAGQRPVGFLIPALVLLVFNGSKAGVALEAIARAVKPAGVFQVTLPWFVGLCLAHRDFLHYGLVEESFNRFTSVKMFHRSEPVIFIC